MTLNHGNYGIFLNMGNAGFLSSTVVQDFVQASTRQLQAPLLIEVLCMSFGRKLRHYYYFGCSWL